MADAVAPRQLIVDAGALGPNSSVTAATPLIASDAFEFVIADHAPSAAVLGPAPYDPDVFLVLTGLVLVNGTAPGQDIVLDMRPVSTSGGGAGVSEITLGSAVTGSSLTLTTPSANSINRVRHTDAQAFTPPSDGAYSLVASSSSNHSAGSVVRARMCLWMLTKSDSNPV